VKTKEKLTGAVKDATDKLPTDEATGLAGKARLAGDLQNLAGATAGLAASKVVGRLGSLADRLEDYSGKGGKGGGEGGQGGPGLMGAVTGIADRGQVKKTMGKAVMKAGKGAFLGRLKAAKDKVMEKIRGGGGAGGGGGKLKVTNIVEMADVGVPLRMAYDQWTRFTEFPQFMKKVENVSQESDEKLVWQAKVFWSRRQWESTILEQIPDSKIVWRSKGAKGSVDGAVTFHELAPELTKVVLILEYHPKGFMERTGNLWRAQGRRARLELKHFQRHVMSYGLLHPDEIEGWRGKIHDGQVVPESESDEAEDTEAKDTEAEGTESEGTELEDSEAESDEAEDTESESEDTEDTEDSESEDSEDIESEDTGEEDADVDEREERAPRAKAGRSGTQTVAKRRSQR
jgi:uncharacterized membrane protein